MTVTTQDNTLLTILNSFGFIKIAGPAPAAFLQGQITVDIQDIDEQHGALSACCDHKGRVIANFFIFQMQDGYYCLLPQTMIPILIKHLSRYAIFSKTQLSPVSEWIACEYFGANDLPHDAAHAYIFPRASHILILPRMQASTLTRWLAINSVINYNTWQQKNIDSGLAWIVPETSRLFIPQMIDLDRWNGVSFTKGCYIGQEIIARTQHLGKLKRHLCRACVQTTQVPHQGDVIMNEKKEALGTLIAQAKINDQQYAVLAVLQDRAMQNNMSTFYYNTLKQITPYQFIEVWKRCH